eukprot:3272593-Rhodomonas_salina.1
MCIRDSLTPSLPLPPSLPFPLPLPLSLPLSPFLSLSLSLPLSPSLSPSSSLPSPSLALSSQLDAGLDWDTGVQSLSPWLRAYHGVGWLSAESPLGARADGPALSGDVTSASGDVTSHGTVSGGLSSHGGAAVPGAEPVGMYWGWGMAMAPLVGLWIAKVGQCASPLSAYAVPGTDLAATPRSTVP